MTNHVERWSARRFLLATALAGTLAGACTNATDVQLLEIARSGFLFGQVYLDLDGSRGLTAADRPIANTTVLLLSSGTAEVVAQVVSDSLGVFSMGSVPLGAYTLALSDGALGDTLETLGPATPLVLSDGDSTLVNIGASYPYLAIEEIPSTPPGRRVFTSGIALNQRVNFDPTGQVHFAGDSLFLRGTNVARSGIAPGDSVRLLGRVTLDNGRNALDQVTPFVLVTSAALVSAQNTTTALAATADGGRLDAALVRIRGAEITDTSTTVDGSFRFWANDGSASIEVVIREFLGLNKSAFRPDTIIRISQADGLLTPFVDGGGNQRWRLLPRGGGDIALETKFADIQVATSIDTAQASLGDTVQITVVVTNRGPLTATGVTVRDTLPSALGLVSSTASSGAWSGATGVWNIGDMVNGAADTLRLRAEVVNGTPATLSNLAQSLGLTLQVDPVAANNSSSVSLTIS